MLMTKQQEPLMDRPKVSLVSPYEVIAGNAKSLLAKILNESDREKCQNHIRELDQILKNLSKLQSDIGNIRKEAGAHNQKLRQANPKGKPAEGTVRELPNGSMVVYFDGSWFPYINTESANIKKDTEES
jgi:flagellin-like hook-associated protein FlgL